MAKKRNKINKTFDLTQALQQSELLINQGNYPPAEKILKKILSRVPECASAMVLRGLIYSQLGQFQQAVKCVENAIRIAPDNSEYHNFLAICYKDMGNYAAAELQFEQAIKLNPDNAEAYNNLANIYKDSGRYDEARGLYQQAVEKDPDYAVAHTHLGVIYYIMGAIDLAIASHLSALKINPSSPESLGRLGEALFTRGDTQLALDCYQKALRLDPESIPVRRGWMEVIRDFRADEYGDSFAQDLLFCIHLDGVNYQNLSPSISSLISLKYDYDVCLSNDHFKDTVIDLSNDELFLQFLIKTINTYKETEFFLTQLRERLLFASDDCLDQCLVLISALSQQCINNEYVFSVGVVESERLEEVRNSIEVYDFSTGLSPQVEKNILLFSMYDSLWSLKNRAELLLVPTASWSSVLSDILQRNLYNCDIEDQLRDKINTLNLIEDQVSVAVQAQYEENPYPRWMYLEDINPIAFSLLLRKNLAQFVPPEFVCEPKQVLIAGCGTGRHPIEETMMVYLDSNVIAVDLSKSSLAYAVRMANQFDISNIEFIQSDILDLGLLDKKFHVIESMGVLHHMEVPLEGFKVLAGLLEDGGLMRVGLYSELARQDIVAGRSIISQYEIGSDKDDIRALRQQLFSNEDEAVGLLMDRKDFYSLSECRDLLFHVQEHRYTIPEIQSTLTELGLRFLGFEFSDHLHKRRFREHYPDEASLADLDCWHTYEQHYPETFVSMYNFWCQKI